MPLRVTEPNFLAHVAPGTLRWASQQSGDSIGSCGQVPAGHLTWLLHLAYRCFDLTQRDEGNRTGHRPLVSFVRKGMEELFGAAGAALWPRHNLGTF